MRIITGVMAVTSQSASAKCHLMDIFLGEFFLRMTSVAEFLGLVPEQVLNIRVMRIMAHHTHSPFCRQMDILACEFLFFMTLKAELRHIVS
jgi:hypothetical protein